MLSNIPKWRVKVSLVEHTHLCSPTPRSGLARPMSGCRLFAPCCLALRWMLRMHKCSVHICIYIPESYHISICIYIYIPTRLCDKDIVYAHCEGIVTASACIPASHLKPRTVKQQQRKLSMKHVKLIDTQVWTWSSKSTMFFVHYRIVSALYCTLFVSGLAFSKEIWLVN